MGGAPRHPGLVPQPEARSARRAPGRRDDPRLPRPRGDRRREGPWWARAVDAWPAYDAYQAKTDSPDPGLRARADRGRRSVMSPTAARFPLGAALTLEQLDADPYGPWPTCATTSPCRGCPALDGWLVTRRDLCIAVMRDAGRFTVDDPRFSTAQVVGPSMLSLDGDEHRRHRDPFARAFLGPDARSRFAEQVESPGAAARGDLDAGRPSGDPARPGRSARGRRRCRGARAGRHGARGHARLVRRDRRRGRSGLGRRDRRIGRP